MNSVLKLAICSILGLMLQAHAEDAAQPDALGPISFATLLDPAQLEARGARIGRIDVVVDEVFEQTDPPLSAPYRIANSLHMATRDAAVRAQLLIQSGERFEQRRLEETERALRARRYLSEARVVPIEYHEDGTVDLQVRVQDVWTLLPSFSVGRKGGSNSAEIEIEDSNLLGLGKELSLEKSSDVDRDTWRLLYGDPNVFGSRWRLAAAYFTSSDGGERTVDLRRPFYSLDTRWSAHVTGSTTRAIVPRYSLGHVVDEFTQEREAFAIGTGWSNGLHDGWTRRLLAGVRYENRQFSPATRRRLDMQQLPLPGVLPEDRRLAYPWIGFEVLEDQYRPVRNLNQIGRTEDLYLGRAARFEVGLASEALGSTRDGVLLNGSLQAGTTFSERQFMITTLQLSGRLESGQLANGLLDMSSRYYLRHSPRRVLVGSLNASVASRLDSEEQLLLGGDSGLRGYPLRYQGGTSRALLTLEERFYTNWQPLKLINVGAAVFFDAGRTWGNDPFADGSLGWLKNVGAGLRLGNARSGFGSVLHIDLAYPLDGPTDLDRLQLVIETRGSF